MAGRGVRISRDITSEWTRLTGGLLDRIQVVGLVGLTRKGGEGTRGGGEEKQSIWPALTHPNGGHDRGVREGGGVGGAFKWP